MRRWIIIVAGSEPRIGVGFRVGVELSPAGAGLVRGVDAGELFAPPGQVQASLDLSLPDITSVCTQISALAVCISWCRAGMSTCSSGSRSVPTPARASDQAVANAGRPEWLLFASSLLPWVGSLWARSRGMWGVRPARAAMRALSMFLSGH